MKNRKALNLLLAANAISGFAQGISIISIPWYFTSALHKSSAFGIIYAGITFATLFWSLYCGTLIDKYSRRKIFLSINLIGGVVLGGVAFSGYLSGDVSEWGAVLVFASTIFVFNIHYPAMYAFGQEITEKENYGKTNSLLEIQVQATTMLSGALAAVLLSGTQNQTANIFGFVVHLPVDIQPWPLYKIFAMDALTYFIAVLLILFIRYQPVHQKDGLSLRRMTESDSIGQSGAAEKIIDTGSVMERIKTGYRFLRRHPLIFLFGNASHAIFVVLLVEANQLMPMYVHNHLREDASVYASAEMYYALGALLAGFAITSVFRKTGPVKAIILMMLLTALICAVCSFTRHPLIFYAFAFLIGITNAGTRILRITYLFHHIPNHLMGRTSSVFNVVNILLRTSLIGLFSLPFFSSGNHVIYAFFLCGTFILLWLIPLLMNYRRF